MPHHPEVETNHDTQARRLIEAAYDDQPPAAEQPGVRPDVAALLDRHRDEARQFASTPYTPAPPPPAAEPVPGWMKGVAMMAPATGGGVWLAAAGVEGVMGAVTPEAVAAVGVGGLVVWLCGRSAAKRGPRKVVTNNDYRGATITSRKSSGITYRSNNG